MVTGLYAAILGFIQFYLTIQIVKRRWKYKVSLGDGGNEDLERVMRVHGNFVETVPIALILIFIAEQSGAWIYFIHFLGLTLIFGRLMHRYALLRPVSYGRYRVIGMVSTMMVHLLGALLCIAMYIMTKLDISLF